MFSIPESHIDQMIKVGGEIVERPAWSLTEETGELLTAISKFANDRINYDIGKQHVVEEMAHVLISMNLVCRQYGITEKDIRREVLVKATKADFDVTNY